MTVRMATCKELSEDREVVKQLAKIYREIEKSASPISVLLPWFPSPGRRAKQKATKDLYTLLLSYVKIRRQAPIPSADAIDFFISEGLSDNAVVGVSPAYDISLYVLMLQQYIMGIVFAGVINTGVNCQCSLLHNII